jgi:hypothetical protein
MRSIVRTTHLLSAGGAILYAEHQPIGGVNRIRKAVYERASTLRHTASAMPRREPNSFADFTDAAPARPRN